jgi:hypothetical protein
MTRVWIISYGAEYMRMDEDGNVSRPAINMPASGQWRITGAVERNNFGHVTARLTLADIKAACNSLNWQWKNGKQRLFIQDYDHGTRREWRTKHSVRSVME